MNELTQAYRKLINKHYSAVQTDTALGFMDKWSDEKKAKKFWDEFHILEKEFIAKLEGIRLE